MIFARKFWSAVALGAFLCALAAFGDILICPKCGYENPEGSKFCVHCQAKLPESKAGKKSDKEKASESYILPSGNLEYLDPEIVKNEIKMGKEHFEKGNVETARLFFRNASALDMLTDPRVENAQSELILRFMKKCQVRSGTVQRKCPVCGGTGKRTMKTASLTGEVKYREVYGKSCPKCGGTGYVLGYATVDERKYRIGRAISRYTMIQRGRKFVPVGNAWVPLGIEEKLSVRQTVSLKRAIASPCPECMGIGCLDCRECNGTGEIKCPNRKCDNGMVKVEVVGRLIKDKWTRTEKCPVCGGRGTVACPECNGNGNVLCKKCNGTGERPICRKCGGQGLITCGRCNGSGLYKGAVCPNCGGEGVVACSSCNGDGRKR